MIKLHLHHCVQDKLTEYKEYSQMLLRPKPVLTLELSKTGGLPGRFVVSFIL
jgi:hypothetical protein